MLQDRGVEVLAIGKINDLYSGCGIDRSFTSKSNEMGMQELDRIYGELGGDGRDRLVLLNLVDFDMLWGHRNDPEGMQRGLEVFDVWLGGFLERLHEGRSAAADRRPRQRPDHAEHGPLARTRAAAGLPRTRHGRAFDRHPARFHGRRRHAGRLFRRAGAGQGARASWTPSSRGENSDEQVPRPDRCGRAAWRLNSHSPIPASGSVRRCWAAAGTVYLGTNVENASFGLSNCAERTAIFRAVTDGETEFEAIAICADGEQPTPPCGACRQVLMEFGPQMVVITAGQDGADGPCIESTVADLLPEAFRDYRSPEKGKA